MIKEDVINRLSSVIPSDRILRNEMLSKHTTFKVGGPAAIYLSVAGKQELIDTLRILTSENVPFYILGNGSNILASDEGYEGVIIEIGSKWSDISIVDDNEDTSLVKADAGVLLGALSSFAYRNSLGGLEFASGIPGTVGGAMVMNAGAYDGEMKDVVESVRALNLDDMCVHEYTNEMMHFAYRHSIVKEERLIVLDVTFKLAKTSPDMISAKMDDFALRRRTKQPLEYPSAGSTFKRPEGFFAGKLIEESNLRGYCVGGAQVSEKHCGFVINKGNATATDIYRLIKEVQEQVYSDSGVRLEPEVIMLGEF
ncbi:MAG: UDP-N-acetylmuramate dehydrogenase [Lachnospiraceae bacterium]|nr:UDP-N-acetylmuramate dehydrogenase [Candidatus Colinaster equi]